MTLLLFYAFTITTFIAGNGASCSVGTSAEYPDKATCDQARQDYEAASMLQQTPTRRVSTLDCTLRVRTE